MSEIVVRQHIKRNKGYHGKVSPKRFHLNGHAIGFLPHTRKLQLHYMAS